jgi:hypothetical protein
VRSEIFADQANPPRIHEQPRCSVLCERLQKARTEHKAVVCGWQVPVWGRLNFNAEDVYRVRWGEEVGFEEAEAATDGEDQGWRRWKERSEVAYKGR